MIINLIWIFPLIKFCISSSNGTVYFHELQFIHGINFRREILSRLKSYCYDKGNYNSAKCFGE